MTLPEPIRYIKPSQRAGKNFAQRGIEGSVIMLNLLRFRDVADYAANPELEPDAPISGAEAFKLYIAHTLPFLGESGGEIVFLGAGGEFLIGPEDERWDLVMLVRQSSVQSFLAFAGHREYLAGLGHRTAAIQDSRLLPMTQLPMPASVATELEPSFDQLAAELRTLTRKRRQTPSEILQREGRAED